MTSDRRTETTGGTGNEAKAQQREATVVIVGASISAWMTAAYLRCELPEADVLVIGPTAGEELRPVVGESLIEISTLFFHRIGLHDYLERTSHCKNGLTFYYRLKDRATRGRRFRYSTHAGKSVPKHMAYQLNREAFDRHLRSHALGLGTQFLHGRVKDVHMGDDRHAHAVSVAKANGEVVRVNSKYLIDCSGRSRVIGKRVTTYERRKQRQRSVYWIRLANFEPFSQNIDVECRRAHDYELWDSTHHFMGDGYWIWGIPFNSAHRNTISLGIVYRPDILEKPLRTLDDVLQFCDAEHPALSDMIRSGTVLDENKYLNYIYWADTCYSKDRWFLIGDAARAYDPLYSFGLSMVAVQIEQCVAMMQLDEAGDLNESDVRAFDRAFLKLSGGLEDEISRQYEGLGDPYQAHLFRYWAVIKFFNGLLPLWYNGFLRERSAVALLLKLLESRWSAVLDRCAMKLFRQASAAIGTPTQAHIDRTMDYDELLNHDFDCDKSELGHNLKRGVLLQSRLLGRVLRDVSFLQSLKFVPVIVVNYLLGKATPWVFDRLSKRAARSCTPLATWVGTAEGRRGNDELEHETLLAVAARRGLSQLAARAASREFRPVDAARHEQDRREGLPRRLLADAVKQGAEL